MVVKKGLLKRISFSNRLSFTILSIIAIVLFATVVYATYVAPPGTSGGSDAGEIANPGHTIQDIGAPSGCAVGQYLQYQHAPTENGGYWACATITIPTATPSIGGNFANGRVYCQGGFTISGSTVICSNPRVKFPNGLYGANGVVDLPLLNGSTASTSIGKIACYAIGTNNYNSMTSSAYTQGAVYYGFSTDDREVWDVDDGYWWMGVVSSLNCSL